MKNKAKIFSILCCAAAVTFAACSDDSGTNKDPNKDPIDNPQGGDINLETFTLQLSGNGLSCSDNATCSVSMKTGSSLDLKATLISSKNGLISGASVKVAAVGVTASSSSVTTDDQGTATVKLTAGNTNGEASVFLMTDAQHGNLVVSVKAIISADGTVTIDDETNYTIKLNYTGNRYSGSKVLVVGDAFLSTKTCAQIIDEANGALSPDEVKALKNHSDNYLSPRYDESNINNLKFTTVAYDDTTYAVVGRGINGTTYAAYGCKDGLNPSNPNVTVDLKDAFIADEPDAFDCNANHCTDLVASDAKYNDCLNNGCDVAIQEGVYTGVYSLQSQFNALSLLPHANVEEGKVAQFTEMQAGDWVEWVLKFLKDPSGQLVSTVKDQLLPLLLNADWLQNVVSSVAGDSFAALLTPEFVSTLIDSFGVTTIIESYLNEILGQLTWWGTTNSIITIVSDLATKFTLAGNIKIVDAPEWISDTGVLNNNIHSYNKFLYNGGKFTDAEGNIACYLGTKIGTDAKENIICSVDIGEIESNIGSVSGKFVASVHGGTQCNSTDKICEYIDIEEHALSLAYGKLVYGAIMAFLPGLLPGVTNVNTIGGILEHYIGYGLVALWNSKFVDAGINACAEANAAVDAANAEAAQYNAENAAAIAAGELQAKPTQSYAACKYSESDKFDSSTLTKCSAIGTVAAAMAKDKLSNTSFGAIIGQWVSAATITPLCTMGIAKLDDIVDNQLSRLTTSADAIKFKTEGNCSLKSDNLGKVTSIGPNDYTWGQETDNRCTWSMHIGGDNEIKGKFHAPRNNSAK